MPREASGLSLEDLRLLSEMLARPRKSVVAAATDLGIPRARLTRLLTRVGDHFQRPLSWRGVDGLAAPAEVRRLVEAFRLFAHELDGGGSPRVSAGPGAAMLFAQTLGHLSQTLPGLRLVRSRDVVESLRTGSIDIALVHASSTTLWPFPLASSPWLKSVTLLPWRAVRCRAPDGPASAAEAFLCWDPGSMGERLAAAHGGGRGHGPGWPCQSFIHALELVRRGIVAQAIVPSIYVASTDSLLSLEYIVDATEDCLLAVYRREDGRQWEYLFQPDAWAAVAGQFAGDESSGEP